MLTSAKRSRRVARWPSLALLTLTLTAGAAARAEVRDKELAVGSLGDWSDWPDTRAAYGAVETAMYMGAGLSFLPVVGLVGTHTGLVLSKRAAPPPRPLGIVELAFAGAYAGASTAAFSAGGPELGAAYLCSSVALVAVGSWTLVANAQYRKVSVAVTPGGFQLSARFH